MKHKEIVYYTLAGHDEVLQSERWCLEGTVQEDKFRLGLGPYAEYKEIPDYAPTNPYPELASYISTICDSNKPAVVPKKSRKAKAKPQATNMSSLQLVLDNTDPIDCVPQVLRDRFNGSINTISNGMD